jgi:hypothetical protein
MSDVMWSGASDQVQDDPKIIVLPAGSNVPMLHRVVHFSGQVNQLLRKMWCHLSCAELLCFFPQGSRVSHILGKSSVTITKLPSQPIFTPHWRSARLISSFSCIFLSGISFPDCLPLPFWAQSAHLQGWRWVRFWALPPIHGVTRCHKTW